LISQEALTLLARIFCGDSPGYFSYKSGPQLVSFFNGKFNQSDRYGQGFPSRWIYVHDKLLDFIKRGIFDSFLDIVLSNAYLMNDLQLTKIKAAEHSKKIYDEFNRILKKDLYSITQVNGKYRLVEENTDLEYVGSGGFAIVHRRKSTNIVQKKLKDEFISDAGIRSRFKREYYITKSLQDVRGVITVYSFDENDFCYTMEAADITLEEFIKQNSLNDDIRIKCIRQILNVMIEVHNRNIIHRDISPNNIFIIGPEVKIADFGIGKDLNSDASHKTMHTEAFGQLSYCAPEQIQMLKNAEKPSDVYSLGKVINFIMTKNPNISNHIFRAVTEKATSNNAENRFDDASKLSMALEKSIRFHESKINETAINDKIARGKFDSDIENYIYELSGDKISQYLIENKSGFFEILLIFMKCDERHAKHVIENIARTFSDECRGSFAANDVFAKLAFEVILGEFAIYVKEHAARILQYIAKVVNRYYAQHLIEDLKRKGIEPILEEILDS